MYKTILTLLALCVAFAAAIAQPYVSDNGFFEVDEVNGCAPFTVRVTIRPPSVCSGASPCEMDYENPVNVNFQNNDFEHTYLQPGTYRLRILFQTLGFDYITINVIPNIQPAFQLYACGGNSAQVNITDTNYDEYVINYNDATPEVVVPQGSANVTHTFATGAGSKLVTVRGRNFGAADNCNVANRTITAMPTLPTPTINQLQVNDESSIRLDLGVQANILYKLEIATNSTTFQALRDVYNSATQTITGLNTNSNYYCFRLGVFDPCSNTIIDYSNIICSADLDVTPINSANRLTWATSSIDVGSFSIAKVPVGTLPPAGPAERVLDDTDVICNREYCYQLTTVYTNGSRSISLSKCAIAISDETPAVTANISIRVTGTNSADLAWTQDPAYTPTQYTVLKAGAHFTTTTDAAATDNTFVLNAGECYAISYVDACGNQSATSAGACHINLAGTLRPGNAVDLSWNAYNGWQNGVDHYIIEKYDTDGQAIGSLNAGTSTTLTDDQEDPDNQVITYRVVAFAVDGGIIESISNEIVITKEPNIYHPNTFTPNNDGLNDTFRVMSQFTETVEFMIFNRWGEMVFITNDLSAGWDGTYKGAAVPEGTYVFRAFLTDMTGRRYERSGNVLLLRKR